MPNTNRSASQTQNAALSLFLSIASSITHTLRILATPAAGLAPVALGSPCRCRRPRLRLRSRRLSVCCAALAWSRDPLFRLTFCRLCVDHSFANHRSPFSAWSLSALVTFEFSSYSPSFNTHSSLSPFLARFILLPLERKTRLILFVLLLCTPPVCVCVCCDFTLGSQLTLSIARRITRLYSLFDLTFDHFQPFQTIVYTINQPSTVFILRCLFTSGSHSFLHQHHYHHQNYLLFRIYSHPFQSRTAQFEFVKSIDPLPVAHELIDSLCSIILLLLFFSIHFRCVNVT